MDERSNSDICCRLANGRRIRLKAVKNTMLLLALTGSLGAQVPTGAIAGVVRDPSGAAVSGAWLKIVSRATSVSRMETSSEQGDYSFPALMTVEYEVSVEA